MPDGLYERDILSWFEHQADCCAASSVESGSTISTGNTLSRIEDAGVCELNAVRQAVTELQNTRHDGLLPRPWPTLFPSELDDLLNGGRNLLEKRFNTALRREQS